MKKIIFALIVFLVSLTITAQNEFVIVGDARVTGNITIDGEFFYEQPHGTFADTTNQTSPSATKAYAVKFSTNLNTPYNISHTAGDSVITIDEAGMYFISFSAIFRSSAPNKTFNVWPVKNNVPVPISNTVFQLLGTNQERVITITYILEFAATDTFQLNWQSNDASGTIYTTGKQVSPTRPTSPGIILTLNKISD